MDEVEERVKRKQKHKAKVNIVPFVSFALYAPLHDLETTFVPSSPFWPRINMGSNIIISFCA